MRIPSRLLQPLVLFLGSALAGCAIIGPQIRAPESNPPAIGQLATPTPAPTPTEFSLVAGGDVLPGSFLEPYLIKYGNEYPFQFIAPVFKSAEIGLVNLECPLSLRGRRARRKKYTFSADPATASALSASGINAVALANNHILDYGPLALDDTLKALDLAGIIHSGAGRTLKEARFPGRKDIPQGPSVAILSYSLTFPEYYWATATRPGTALARLPQMTEDILAAKTWAQLVVVCFHWGGELEIKPQPYQSEYARAAIDAGARLVIGTHPHVLQGMEWYREGLILYSLGNLAFGGGQSHRTITGGLVKVFFNHEGKLLRATFLPLSVDNLATHFVPTPLVGTEATAVFQFLSKLSQAGGIQIINDDLGWGEIVARDKLNPVTAPLALSSTANSQ